MSDRPRLCPPHLRGLDLEPRVFLEMCRCRYFTGLSHEYCDQGVKYLDVRRKKNGALIHPCLEPECTNCQHREYPTLREAKQQVKESSAAYTRCVIAFTTIIKHTKGVRKGSGYLKCPNCDNGRLLYSFTPNNGHLHARCSTPECCAVIQ